MSDTKLYDHTAEAILFAGIMWWLIKWIARTVREVGEESPPPSDFTVSITQMESIARERELVSVPTPHAYATHSPGASIVAHCPACGYAVSAAPQPLPFAAECPNCKRHVSVRGDGPGRLSVVVSDSHP